MIHTHEDILDATEVRKHFADALNRVRYSGERIILRRHKSQLAALVSMDDLALLRALEDRLDLDDANKALKSGKRHSLAAVKKELGL